MPAFITYEGAGSGRAAIHGFAVHEEHQGTWRNRGPGLVVGQRRGGHDGHPVGRRGQLPEVDGDVLILQVGSVEGGLPHDVGQP